MIRGLQGDYKILLKPNYLPLNSPFSVDRAGATRRKSALVLIAFSAVLGSLPGCAAQSKTKVNPWVATWRLDPALSRLAGPAADGTAFRDAFDGPPDGSPHPVRTREGPSYQASFRWTADGVLHGETVDPQGAAKSFTVELSGDGKTLTETRHVKTPTAEYDLVLVFRRTVQSAGSSKR